MDEDESALISQLVNSRLITFGGFAQSPESFVSEVKVCSDFWFLHMNLELRGKILSD